MDTRPEALSVPPVSARVLVTRLAPGLVPFRAAVRAGVPMVMLSTAAYPAYGREPAAWSPRIIGRLLGTGLGFRGVTITDSLGAAAAAHHAAVPALALRCARAGADILLVTGARSSARAYAALLAAARRGTLPVSGLDASYRRILALKARLR